MDMSLAAKAPKILVVGSINMDLRISLDRVPDAGETVFGKSYFSGPGGKGANQAVAAARLRAEVTLVGAVGNDDNGEILTEGLKSEGIETTFIRVDHKSPTGLAVINVESSGQNRIIVLSGANMEMDSAHLRGAFEHDYDMVLMQLEVPPEIVYETYRLANERNIPVALDAGPAIQLDLDKLKGIEIITPNESETAALTGIPVTDGVSAAAAARCISERSGAKYVVLKLGAGGALLYKEGSARIFPATEGLPVIDTTAAGDAFTAALTMCYIETGNICKSIEYANSAGAICVSRAGAQTALPTADEVTDIYVNTYKKTV